MRILFATGLTHLPDQVGGAERSMHTLLELLREHGHECEAVVGLGEGRRRRIARRLYRLSRGRWLRLSDRRNGYRTHRTAPRWVAKLTCQRLKRFVPDIVITQLDCSHEIITAALSRDVRVVLVVRDVEFDLRTWPTSHPFLRIFSNSNFVASRLQQQLGLSSVVFYPPVRTTDYYVEKRAPETITFINPVPLKGIERALAVAALLPHRRFLFVESWRLDSGYRLSLFKRLESLPNVKLTPWTPDIKTVYSRTAVLMVPSEWEEAFGRVALEAQVSGIPVIGRDIGGMSEVLQNSGTLIRADASPQDWADELERLLTDSSLYTARSAAARANAGRPEFDPERQLERFLSLVTNW